MNELSILDSLDEAFSGGEMYSSRMGMSYAGGSGGLLGEIPLDEYGSSAPRVAMAGSNSRNPLYSSGRSSGMRPERASASVLDYEWMRQQQQQALQMSPLYESVYEDVYPRQDDFLSRSQASKSALSGQQHYLMPEELYEPAMTRGGRSSLDEMRESDSRASKAATTSRSLLELEEQMLQLESSIAARREREQMLREQLNRRNERNLQHQQMASRAQLRSEMRPQVAVQRQSVAPLMPDDEEDIFVLNHRVAQRRAVSPAMRHQRDLMQDDDFLNQRGRQIKSASAQIMSRAKRQLEPEIVELAEEDIEDEDVGFEPEGFLSGSGGREVGINARARLPLRARLGGGQAQNPQEENVPVANPKNRLGISTGRSMTSRLEDQRSGAAVQGRLGKADSLSTQGRLGRVAAAESNGNLGDRLGSAKQDVLKRVGGNSGGDVRSRLDVGIMRKRKIDEGTTGASFAKKAAAATNGGVNKGITCSLCPVKYEENGFCCDMCNDKFSTNFNLQDHLRRAHKNNQEFSCELCHVRFITMSKYHAHLTKYHRVCETHYLVIPMSRLVASRKGFAILMNNFGAAQWNAEKFDKELLGAMVMDLKNYQSPDVKLAGF